MAEEEKKEAISENTEGGGGSKAMLGVVLGMVLAMALGFGAVVMFSSSGDAEADANAAESDNSKAESFEGENLGVKMKAAKFFFAGTNGTRKGTVEITFYIKPSSPEAKLEIQDELFGAAINEAEGIFALKEYNLKVLDLRRDIIAYFSRQNPKFLDKYDARIIAERHVIPMLDKLFAVKSTGSTKQKPPLATVESCYLELNPY